MSVKQHIRLVCLLAITIISAGKLAGQGCSGSTPHYTIDMTGSPDSIWVSPSVSRNGTCCGATGSDRCIHFTITLDANAQGVRMDVSGGTGATYYTISCGSSTSIGDTICLSGVGPHEVTICKPGANVQTYTITSISKPHVVDDTVLMSPSCSKTLRVKGVNLSSITWQSVGNNSTYNSYLSCLSGCDTTVVTIPASGFPTYVDYVISGYNVRLLCDTNKFYDTIRVYMYSKPDVSISPKPAYVCTGTSTVNVTANVTGGLAPYHYLWSDAGTSATRAFSPGTYWVRVTDSLGCFYDYDTVTITASSKPAAAITGNDTLCQNTNNTYRANSGTGKTYLWTCATATFNGAATLDSAILAFAQAGSHTLSLKVTDTVTGCDSTITKQVYVSAGPIANIVGNDSTICASVNSVKLSGVTTNAGSFQWTGQGGGFIPNSTAASPTYIPSLTEVAAGSTYVVLSSTSTGCATVRDTIRITINPAPTPVISGAAEVCEYTSSQNYSVATVPGSSYDWHIVGGTIVSGQGTDEINVTWDTTGPGYMYMVQTSSGGCQGVGAINTISRFDFNGGPLSQATIGPNASSFDSDAYSNGQGYVITNNTGGNKGIDLTIPGTVFDRGRMCMTFSWQRDESQADFFTRGGVSFRIRSGILEIGMRLSDGLGGYIDTGPVSSGYTVPDDDIFRYYTFCYDSASGIGRVMVNDSLVWSYNGTAGRSLYWTGAGSATIGVIMDGSGKGNTLLDWSNISIPITVLPRPKPTLSGPLAMCQNKGAAYTVTSGQSYFKNTWSVSGGTILNGQNTNTINVLWTTAGTQTVTVTQLDTINGCDSTMSLSVVVSPTPAAAITGIDTICIISPSTTFNAPVIAGASYQWTCATATFNGAATLDSVKLIFTQTGTHTISLTVADTVSGCDSTITKQVYVDTLPVAVVTGNSQVCEGSTGEVYTATYNASYTYSWAINGGTITAGAATNAATVNWTTAGNKTVQVTVTKLPAGCSDTIIYNVLVMPLPITGPINHD